MFLSSQLSITASRTMTSVSGRMAMTSPSLSTTTPRTVRFDMATFWGRTHTLTCACYAYGIKSLLEIYMKFLVNKFPWKCTYLSLFNHFSVFKEKKIQCDKTENQSRGVESIVCSLNHYTMEYLLLKEVWF